MSPLPRPLTRLAISSALLMLAVAGRSWMTPLLAHTRITTTITWDREISAIVQTRCLTCHTGADGAPMSLATYELARPWARAIRHEVLTRRMPKWHAARGYGDFANDPSLSPFEISLIAAWVDGGAPKAQVLQVLPVLQVPPNQQDPQHPKDLQNQQNLKNPQDLKDVREVQLPCGDRAVPAGRLVGLRPRLDRGASVRVIARLPDGRREILGWFRDFDPDYAPTYWLRTPLDMPSGTRLVSEGDKGDCRVVVVLSPGSGVRGSQPVPGPES